MIQLNPPIFLTTPKGKALAHFVIDYGIDHDLYWVCFMQDTGECWTFSNRDIRIDRNDTIGRAIPKPFYEPEYEPKSGAFIPDCRCLGFGMYMLNVGTMQHKVICPCQNG